METLKLKPNYQIINGLRVPGMFSPKCVQEALDYKPRDDDVFIVTFSKCGTTWAQNLVVNIYRKGVPLDNPKDLFLASPFIDMIGLQGIQKMWRPGAIKTHLPFNMMPYSPKAKYIFVVRNPLDTCVSLYHHTRLLRGYGYWNGEFDDFYELFLEEEVEYNGYFNHLSSWFPHRNEKNIIYKTYEDMKKDIKSVVHEFANFIGEEYGKVIEMDNNVLNAIVHNSSFEVMKRDFEDLYDTASLRNQLANDPDMLEGLKYLTMKINSLNPPENLPKIQFVRKGIVGDYKNLLSSEQIERMNKKFDEVTKGTGIQSLWSM